MSRRPDRMTYFGNCRAVHVDLFCYTLSCRFLLGYFILHQLRWCNIHLLMNDSKTSYVFAMCACAANLYIGLHMRERPSFIRMCALSKHGTRTLRSHRHFVVAGGFTQMKGRTRFLYCCIYISSANPIMKNVSNPGRWEELNRKT